MDCQSNRSEQPGTRHAQLHGLAAPLFAIAVLIGPAPATADDATAAVTTDVAAQKAIDAVASTRDETQSQAAWQQVRARYAADQTALLQQLVLYSANATNAREKIVAGAVIDELDVPERTVVRAIVPLLDSEDAAVRRQTANVLGNYEDASAGRPPNFALYRELVAEAVRRGEEPPAGLVRHLYATHPGNALLSLMRAMQVREPERLKQILWAEHVIADTLWKQEFGFLQSAETEPAARSELSKLSRDEAWWARLYAAEIMRRHEAFRSTAIVDDLRNDEHELVRESIATLDEPAASRR